MTCHSSLDGTVHICCPNVIGKHAHARICPDCGKWTRFIGVYYEWYGPESTCIKCGRHWSDGEWMPLDFVPQSRQKSIESAKHTFRHAIIVPLDLDQSGPQSDSKP